MTRRPKLSWKDLLAVTCDETTPLNFLDLSLPPPIGFSSTERGMHTYLISMHQLMMKDPECFSRELHHPVSNAPCVNHGFSDEVIDPSARRNGHLPKDWNRAYWLFIAYKRCTHHLLRLRLLHHLRRLRLCLSLPCPTNIDFAGCCVFTNLFSDSPSLRVKLFITITSAYAAIWVDL